MSRDEFYEFDLEYKLRENLIKKGISYIFITHDIIAVQKISDRLIVLQDGRIVEEGITHEIIKKPKHRYTKELIKPVLKNIYLN